MELISVIVPVFNTGLYLKRCIDSILKQDYSNLEIILVDDGSDDDITNKLCKEYASFYNNITLIEQENQGSSAARNTGVEHARGEYIGFVDSDDVIEKNMYSELFKTIKKYKTKIAFCDLLIKDSIEENNTKVCSNSPIKSGIYNQSEALHFFLLGHWHSACTVLYVKELFTTERFPYGETNEDFILLFRLLLKLENISYVNEKLYYYIKRPESNTGIIANKKHLDWIAHTIEVKKKIGELSQLNTSLESQAQYQYLFSNIVLGNKVVLSNIYGSSKERDEMYKVLVKNLRKDFSGIITNRYLGRKKRLMGLTMSIAPNIYMAIICFILRKSNILRKYKRGIVSE